jgi:hypothetical protein
MDAVEMDGCKWLGIVYRDGMVHLLPTPNYSISAIVTLDDLVQLCVSQYIAHYPSKHYV